MTKARSLMRLWRVIFTILFVTLGSGACFGATLFERSLALFQARAQEAAPHDYTFVVLGDSRDGDAVFRKALQLAASYQPLFILHGGDYSDRGGPAETEQFLNLVQETIPAIPLFVVVGNHENRGIFQQKVGPLHFTVHSDRLGLTVVALDNASYVLSPSELSYLRSALQEQKGAFVAMHIPPKTKRWSRHTFTDGADELQRILEQGKVQASFFGHVHQFDRAEFGGAPAFITGGAGAPLVRFGFPGEAAYHILVVRVKGGRAFFERVVLPR